MNNNIDFSDFHKISVDHPTKCRKFTKHRFTILSFLIIILLVIVIIIYVNKNNQIKTKEKELSPLENNVDSLKSNLSIILNLVNNSKNNYTSLELNYTNTIKNKENKNSELDSVATTNEQLKTKRKSVFEEYRELHIKLDTFKNYEKQIKEKTELIELINERLNNLEIGKSNVVTDVTIFENESSKKVKNKCYDSIVYEFNPEKFYENCLGEGSTPLLFLIKTKKGEKIGVYTSTSYEEEYYEEDNESMLINFDKSKIFKYYANLLSSNDKCYIYWNSENFPQFAEDLIINSDGSGKSTFPTCYGTSDGEQKDFVQDTEFNIEILEIYKVNDN